MTATADIREDTVDANALLSFLAQVKEGDFTARLPVHWLGLAGKVADDLNEISMVNQKRRASVAPLAADTGWRRLSEGRRRSLQP